MKKIPLLVSVLVIISLISCKKDLPDIGSTLSAEQKWVLDSMRHYYLWSHEIKIQSQHLNSISEFFNSLLSKEDRFSYLKDLSSDTPPSFEQSYGFYIETFKDESGETAAVVSYVAETGPAEIAGIRRGDIIAEFNGLALPETLDDSYMAKLVSSGKLDITFASGPVVSLAPGYSFDNPVRISRVLTVGTKKVGYLYISRFDHAYNDALIDVFNVFKNEDIDDLTIDVRYNGGGDVSNMALLAYLLTGLPLQTPFMVAEGNQNIGKLDLTIDGCMAEQVTSISRDKAANTVLGLSEVTVITGQRTASASEALVNCLQPYVTVNTVGATTYGKDVGSIAIASRDARVNIEAHPIVFRLFNSSGLGSYANGLQPKLSIDEDPLHIHQLGDVNETILSIVVNNINNGYPNDKISERKMDGRRGRGKTHTVHGDSRNVNPIDLTHQIKKMNRTSYK